MNKIDYTNLLIKFKTLKLNNEQLTEILDIIFGKSENKLQIIQASQFLVQKYINFQDKFLNKYILAVENGHPNTTLKKQSPYNFIQYVKQHTQNGTTLNSCKAFEDYFNKIWLPFAKEQMFNSIDWQKEQGHKIFFDNLKKSLKLED